MKKRNLTIPFCLVLLGLAALTRLGDAAEQETFQTYEYATIRWAGRDNTHLIRPNGDVEMLGPILKPVKRPARTDERCFYMNIALNAAAHEGYELQSITHDQYVLRRPALR